MKIHKAMVTVTEERAIGYECERCNKVHEMQYQADACERVCLQSSCKHDDVRYSLSLYSDGGDISKYCSPCGKYLGLLELNESVLEDFAEAIYKKNKE